MGLLEGKVVVVSGAARGQGRAIAVRFAEEGADVVALDVCADMPTTAYPGARPEDLAGTGAMIKALDRRCSRSPSRSGRAASVSTRCIPRRSTPS